MSSDPKDSGQKSPIGRGMRRPERSGAWPVERERRPGDPGTAAGIPPQWAIPAPEKAVPRETDPSRSFEAPEPVEDLDVSGFIHVPRAVRPGTVPPDAGQNDPSLFFNRELSWLDFNWRVLYQALDDDIPLLERVRFLAITENNLDEFVMKRVGGLKRQREAGVMQTSADGRTPAEQLELVRDGVRVMRERMAEAWECDLRPSLQSDAGVVLRDFVDLSDSEREEVHDTFRKRIYPILTPLAVDPGHPFPFLSNLSLSLALMLVHPDRKTRHFARLKIPTGMRWIVLPESGHYVPVEQVISGFVGELFRGMTVESASLFRVTRNADVSRDEEVADDLLRVISEELRERRFAPVVRIEVEPSTPAEVRDFLLRELGLDNEDLYEIPGLMALQGLNQIVDEGPWEHRYEPWEPMIPPRLLREGETEDAPDLFAVIRAGDLIVHHPYDSFTATVERFIQEAADDPTVVAIKQTLYRTSENSQIIDALVRAAEADKEVAVLVEVTARFDEQDNVEWASVLEEAGVHVTYGLVGLKTHAKIALVLRDEDEEIRPYCHIGTGNYNSETAHIYTDFGVFTARPEVGRDAVNLFHYLTGYAPEQEYEELVVAPRALRRTILERIETETELARAGKDGRIVLKLNGLDDPEIVKALYAASNAGVEIDLIVRGQCMLRPGLPGWSENIRVRSIIGRFLEHDRIYWFANDGDPVVWIGSADCRRRNLDGRVEVMLPICDPRVRKRLRKTLKHALADNQRSWDLQASGEYVHAVPLPGGPVVDYHQKLMRSVKKQRRKADAPWDIDRGD
jgi:polyphosphate kinase